MAAFHSQAPSPQNHSNSFRAEVGSLGLKCGPIETLVNSPAAGCYAELLNVESEIHFKARPYSSGALFSETRPCSNEIKSNERGQLPVRVVLNAEFRKGKAFLCCHFTALNLLRFVEPK